MVIVGFVEAKPFGPDQLYLKGPEPAAVTVKLAEEPAHTGSVGGLTVEVGGGAIKTFTSAVVPTLSIHCPCWFGFSTVAFVYSNLNCRNPAVVSASVIA